MEYTTLGSTGMEVSKICLGGMSFGTENEVHEWILEEEESREIIERAIDLGINFFDTANAYSMGESERILGDVLGEYDRDEQVVATKVFFPTNFFSGEDEPHPNASGLSRKTIEQELENSLDRLGMDTVDLYQIHRWDDDTPIEETLGTLDDAVRRNQVRYVGASSMWAHQFQAALHASDRLGLEPVPMIDDLYRDRIAAVDGLLTVGGGVLLVAGQWWDATPLVHAGGGLVVLGFAAFAANLALVIHVHSPASLAGVVFGSTVEE